MVLMYEEEELYSGLEGSSGGSVTRLMDTQYRISFRLYWIDYKRDAQCPKLQEFHVFTLPSAHVSSGL